MGNRVRKALAVAGVSAAGLAAGVAGSAGAATSGKKDSGTSYVAIVHQKGSVAYAAGYSVDKLFKQAALTYQITAAPGTTGTVKVTAKKVIEYTSTGSLIGTATAVESLATGKITKGKLKLTKGTGALKGHTFTGTFTGSYNAKTGVYTFHYAGKVK